MNTVTISIKEYDELREFKKKTIKGLNIFEINNIYGEKSKYSFLTNDETIKFYNDKIKEYFNHIKMLEEEKNHFKNLNKKMNILENSEIKRISKFSIFQFIKWRKKIKNDF